MIKIVNASVIAMLLLGSVATINAQERRENKQDMYEKMKEEINLSDAQLIEIKKVNDSHQAQREILWKQMDELKNKEKEEVEKILTSEQKEKLKLIRQKKHSNNRKSQHHK